MAGTNIGAYTNSNLLAINKRFDLRAGEVVGGFMCKIIRRPMRLGLNSGRDNSCRRKASYHVMKAVFSQYPSPGVRGGGGRLIQQVRRRNRVLPVPKDRFANRAIEIFFLSLPPVRETKKPALLFARAPLDSDKILLMLS